MCEEYYRSNSRVWVCKYCGNEFHSRRKLINHHLVCDIKLSLPKDSLGRTKQIYTEKDAVICKFCNKEFVNSQSFKHHVLYCKENPNHLNKVQAKHTDEAKQKISNARRRALAEGKGSKWICPHINRSYAEQYFYDCFTNAGISFCNNVWIKHYCVDFLFDNNVYIEIDGEQHFTDDAIKHDIERDKFLLNLGYKCLCRIRWASFNKLSLKEKRDYVCNLVSLLNESRTKCISIIEFDDELLSRLMSSSLI